MSALVEIIVTFDEGKTIRVEAGAVDSLAELPELFRMVAEAGEEFITGQEATT